MFTEQTSERGEIASQEERSSAASQPGSFAFYATASLAPSKGRLICQPYRTPTPNRAAILRTPSVRPGLFKAARMAFRRPVCPRSWPSPARHDCAGAPAADRFGRAVRQGTCFGSTSITGATPWDGEERPRGFRASHPASRSNSCRKRHAGASRNAAHAEKTSRGNDLEHGSKIEANSGASIHRTKSA